jgi:DNA-binding winged helix-turn-helix (wHTH) protein
MNAPTVRMSGAPGQNGRSSIVRRSVIGPARPVGSWNRATGSGQPEDVVPTVYLVGIDELERIPEYLDLGLIVVVSPDPTTLRRWQHEQDLGIPVAAGPAASSAVVVEMDARRISSRGVPLTLSEMEFRVLARLANEPGRALSFAEIRRLGWGDDVQLPLDLYAIRSLIQRLRAKLRAVEANVTIAPVRSYGFRLESDDAPVATRDPAAASLAR